MVTRMHSSRMRTGRSLTVCCSLLPGGVLPAGGVSAWSEGVLPAGGVSVWSGEGSAWSRGVSLVLGGSAWSGGGSPCLVWGGFSLVLGGCLPGPGGVSPWSRGVCLVPGGSPWSRGGSLETPPVNRITDTCKNITLATTSLRPVIITDMD